jgi:hypothetical protein
VAVTVYRSTDGSAPTLSGTAGDLVNVLDKCLVAGYGSKAAAGWTKPYTGTNTAVFRMGAGNQFYLDVNDNAPGVSTSQEARVRGYETMSAVATGTGPFPTVAQFANGLFVRKSAAASGTGRVWTLIADDRTLYLLIQSGDTAGQWYCTCFGDFYSYVAGTDNFRTLLIARVAEGSAAASTERTDLQSPSGAVTGHYAARAYTGLGGSNALNKNADQRGNQGSSVFGSGGLFGVPNPADGNVWLSPVSLADPAVTFRGKMRGFMAYMHSQASYTDQDTVAGAGIYTGHTFLLFKTTPNGGGYCIDITGPWDTN